MSQKKIVNAREEEDAVEEAAQLSPLLVFEAIRRAGEEELLRPNRALWFSGVTAGLLISFSIVGEAVFRVHLPDTEWRFLIENFGYSFGFLLVILGRMQLFTENTITTVVPVMLECTAERGMAVLQLWMTVLAANVVGAFMIATFYAFTPVLSAELAAAFAELSRHATGYGPWEGFVRAIPAGVLIAALVWMMPSTPGSLVALIIIFTWLIALGDFTHVVAGSVEMAFLVVRGELSLADGLFRFFLPVLAGNVVGGTLIFTALAWAQIKADLTQDGSEETLRP
ncbi:MAG: formate/nitrite transporter family protein [Pseudomonadota bacterium]